MDASLGVPLDKERERSTERGVGLETQRLARYQAQAGKARAQFLEHDARLEVSQRRAQAIVCSEPEGEVRFAEPSSRSRFAAAGTGTPPISTASVVLRRQAMTEESKRSTSSMAFGIRSPPHEEQATLRPGLDAGHVLVRDARARGR
jgi:hypothetical protein